MRYIRPFITTIVIAVASVAAHAQMMWVNGRWVDQNAEPTPTTLAENELQAQMSDDEFWADFYDRASRQDVTPHLLGPQLVSPAIFDRYDVRIMAAADSIALPAQADTVADPLAWINGVAAARDRGRRLMMRYMVDNPGMVAYNSRFFDTPAKIYVTTFDPTTAQVQIKDVTDSLLAAADASIAPPKIERRNWLQSFDGLVQFTQAYNSPNWYQGGNSNLNMLVNAVYSFKLNPQFHPDLLFENTLQYKLALTSAPEDELRNYSINEDLLQFNTKFGIRAARRWFYSLSGQLKTQILNNYISNTHDLKAAFMSPGEVNLGLGMTYNYLSKKEKFRFDLTIAPISYNLKTCLHDRVDGTAFGIDPGRKTDNQFGANIEGKLTWQIAYNITLSSRLYVFSDYSYVQGDLENTLSFTINRFLSTQIYAHLRYDSQTPRLSDSRWHKWQLKEIFSFGFAYKFATT